MNLLVVINPNKNGKGGNVNITGEQLEVAEFNVGDDLKRTATRGKIVLEKKKKLEV